MAKLTGGINALPVVHKSLQLVLEKVGHTFCPQLYRMLVTADD